MPPGQARNCSVCNNTPSYWEVLEPARGGCVLGVTGGGQARGQLAKSLCAGWTALFLFPPKPAGRSIQSGVKPPHSKGRDASGGSPSWRLRGGSGGPALPVEECAVVGRLNGQAAAGDGRPPRRVIGGGRVVGRRGGFSRAAWSVNRMRRVGVEQPGGGRKGPQCFVASVQVSVGGGEWKMQSAEWVRRGRRSGHGAGLSRLGVVKGEGGSLKGPRTA